MHNLPLYYGGMEGAPRAPRRFKPRGRHPDKALSAAFVRTAAPGRYCDGQGLYLFVQPSGTRSWVQRIAIRGRRHELGLGSAALVPLAEARAKALANRKIAREGGDPLAEKRRAATTPSFAAAAARVLEQKQAGWSNSRHESTWIRSLETYAFPRIGGRLVSEVTSADVLDVLTPIWHEKAQTARRVRQRIRIDTSDRVWTIPATRMKAQRAHRVPLCGRAIEILKAARMLGDGSGPLVFPSGGGTPLPDKKLRRMLQDRNIAAVPHGFRSSFRDWATERTDHPREVIEAALAHAVLSKVEAAYARSDLFERRRLLMDDWSTHLDGERRAQDSSRN